MASPVQKEIGFHGLVPEAGKFVTPCAAFVFGLVAGVLVVISVYFFEHIGIDDPVGAISSTAGRGRQISSDHMSRNVLHALRGRRFSLTPRMVAAASCFLAAVLCATPAGAAGDVAGFVPPVWTMFAFPGLLLSIAILPLFFAQAWGRYFPFVSLLWLLASLGAMYAGTPSDADFLSLYGANYLAAAQEYFAFIVLLGSLFVIAGGIHVSGHLPGEPGVNTLILLLGSVLASLIGTTGASMVLVRPLLRANESRKRKAHVMVFFIFIVSNIGGVLTPIGDPPLFLGFLRGIPFQWTLTLAPIWALCVGILLVVFYAVDDWLFRVEKLSHSPDGIHFRIAGKHNLLLMVAVIGTVLATGVLHFNAAIDLGRFGVVRYESLLRDGLLILLAGMSVWQTRPSIRRANNFSFGAIREVAILFAAIFFTMIPVTMMLSARGGALGLNTPAQYFWFSGALSSFLDNAPTYLTFVSAATGAFGLHESAHIIQTAQGAIVLQAISAGSVFMGANSYIGNGPNFMVKAIAEQHGVKMPSFFGYMLYSGCILIPLFVLVTFVFF